MPTIITAGGASDSLALSSGNDGLLTLQTGPSGAKVNALALDGSGNAVVLGNLTQAGVATPKIAFGTPVPTTSGTSVLVTGIPSWAKRITISFSGVSTNGGSQVILRIGPSGGVETSGYLGATGSTANTTGISLFDGWISTAVVNGSLVLTLLNASTNLWSISGSLGRSDSSGNSTPSGSKPLAGVLDRFSLTTTGGTDSYDAGSINTIYEG